MKVLVLGILALSISTAAMAQAPAAAEPPVDPNFVEYPVWLPKDKYNGPQFPQKALDKGVSGEAEIICTVKADGRLEKCVIESETPPGNDFGKWLIEYSKVLRVKPLDEDGAPTVGKKVAYALNFKNPNKK